MFKSLVLSLLLTTSVSSYVSAMEKQPEKPSKASPRFQWSPSDKELNGING